MSDLSTCARCGGTIERRPGSVYGWGHVTETPGNADGHRPDPDDGYAAGPEEDQEPASPDPWMDPDAAAAHQPPPF
jgi:hypothetical protein